MQLVLLRKRSPDLRIAQCVRGIRYAWYLGRRRAALQYGFVSIGSGIFEIHYQEAAVRALYNQVWPPGNTVAGENLTPILPPSLAVLRSCLLQQFVVAGKYRFSAIFRLRVFEASGFPHAVESFQSPDLAAILHQ